MESRLQSNEVRIPKSAQNSSFSNYLNGSVSSSSTTAGQQQQTQTSCSNIALNRSSSPPDFDFNTPCQYFKSSFARSLYSNSNQTKSLDFGINFGLHHNEGYVVNFRHQHHQATPASLGQINSYRELKQRCFDEVPPPLPQSQPPPLNGSMAGSYETQQKFPSAMVTSSPASFGHHSSVCSSVTSAAPTSSSSMMSSSVSGIAEGSTDVCDASDMTTNNSRNVWSTSKKQNSQRRSFDTPDGEVLRLRKECQNLVEENRRLLGLATGIVGGNFSVPENSQNIEAVVLQTQVDTLQWQLKQVESSRQMYRAVMEEVVRFLERCHRNLDAMQQNGQIARSKSVHHVNQNQTLPVTTSNAATSNATEIYGSQNSSPRPSSANFVQNSSETSTPVHQHHQQHRHQQKSSPPPSLLPSLSTTSGSIISSTNSDQNSTSSYNNFRDFTWRRSPKRTALSQLSAMDCEPEKLSQEAFRLLRTAQNLLHTQEPVLAQSKHALEVQYYIQNNLPNTSFLVKSTTSSAVNCQQQQQQQQQLPIVNCTNGTAPPLPLKPNSYSLDPETFSMTFSRKMNMRESQLSLRSSTDDSVHSNSSSKNETDEENNHSPPILKEMTTCSTEDESGFSSISSFQEIGLPMISMTNPVCKSNHHRHHNHLSTNVVNSTSTDDSGEFQNVDKYSDMDSRNSTLKASSQHKIVQQGQQQLTCQPSHSQHAKVGLPFVGEKQPVPHIYNHRRWGSAPPLPPRNSRHAFSTLPVSADDTPRVLWV